MQMTLVFFSKDFYFLTQVSDFISRTQKEIQIIIYSDQEKAYEYIAKNNDTIKAILADEYFYNKDLPYEVIKIVCSNRTELTSENGRYRLNIYQQGEDIVRDLKKICLEQGVIYTAHDVDKAGKIISFFSIQGGSGQSTIAYQLAANLAQEYKVLYCSLDYVNIYQMLYSVEHPVEMAQLMFGSKEKRIQKESFYQAIVRNQQGIYVLPPFETIGDIEELTEDDIVFLVEQMQALHEFDFILLDLNRKMDDLNRKLLHMSEKVISIYTDDMIGRKKQQQFQIDPYIVKLGLLPKTEFVLSKVLQEIPPEQAGMQFPCVQFGNDLFHTFYDNGNFKRCCLALKERIF